MLEFQVVTPSVFCVLVQTTGNNQSIELTILLLFKTLAFYGLSYMKEKNDLDYELPHETLRILHWFNLLSITFKDVGLYLNLRLFQS